MTTAKQQVRADAPHERSFFAFALTFIAAANADEPPPLWSKPLEVTDGMDAETAAYVRRHTPLLAALEQGWRESAIADLAACGVPADRLEEPLPMEVERLLTARVSASRAVLYAFEATAPMPTKPIFKPAWAIVGPLCHNLRYQVPHESSNSIYTRAATILNAGIPTRDRSQGLDDDHVRRADRACFARLSRLSRQLGRSGSSREQARAVTAAYAFALCEQIELVGLINGDALARPEFRGLTGKALAEAVLSRHHALDLLNKADAVRNWRKAAA